MEKNRNDDWSSYHADITEKNFIGKLCYQYTCIPAAEKKEVGGNRQHRKARVTFRVFA